MSRLRELLRNGVVDMNQACLHGGGKSAPAPAPTYTPPPAAPAAQEATMDTAITPEEEAALQKDALAEGAKSLQIPITSDTTATESTVGTGTTTA